MIAVLPILGQSAAPIEPGQRALDHPSFGQDDEALDLIGALDDLDVDLSHDLADRVAELWSLIAAIGVKRDQEGEHPKQSGKQHRAAVTILDVGGMHDRLEQKTFSIYKDMSFLALDLLACIISVRVNRGPPFSALFTLWLSMIAAVGLASREACSRHFT
jgi:hypothetical protein